MGKAADTAAATSSKGTESKSTPKNPVAKAVKPVGIKREQSDLFKSFAKPKPQVKREDSDASHDDRSETESKKTVRISSVTVQQKAANTYVLGITRRQDWDSLLNKQEYTDSRSDYERHVRRRR